VTGWEQDVRFALRGFRRTPGFAAIAVATLALGIGANAAMFGIVDRVLLKPLPYRDPGALVQVIETWNAQRGYGPPSWADFLDWRTRAKSFAGLVGWTVGAGNLVVRGEPERVRLVESTANLFDLLGVAPALGRGFAAGEDAASAPCVAVIADPLWRERFGADPKLVGSPVGLGGLSCTVIGVAPPRFEFPPGVRDGIWIPLHATKPIFADRGSHFLSTIGRLRPGVSSAAATAEIDGIMRSISLAYPDAAPNRAGRTVPLREWTATDYRPKLLILSAAVGIVLLIACVNVASMLLARATTRRRELAIRVALGAARGRLIRQMLVESALLAAAGGLAGMFVAAGALKLLSRWTDSYLRTAEIAVDDRTLLFGLAASAGTILLFGLLPAVRAARAEASTLHGEIAGSVRGLERVRGVLVTAETALCLVLLSAALLLTRTLAALDRSDLGIGTDHRLTFKLSPSPTADTAAGLDAAVYAPLRRRIAELPGVRSVGTINRLPLDQWGVSGSFLLDGLPVPRDPNEWYAEFRVVSPGFFGGLGAAFLQGRDLAESDVSGAPRVAIVNDEFARRYFPRGDVLGRTFRLERTSPPVEIVGAYRSIRQRGLGDPAEPEIDYPAPQVLPGHGLYTFGIAATETFVVRTTVPPESLVSSIRAAARDVVPGQAPFAFRTMEEIRAESMGGDRLALILTGAFAAIAIVLCIAGIHGVMSYFVARRSRDIGIRMALGATRGNVLGLVLRAAFALAALGVLFGIAGSVAAGGFLRSILFGVRPGDPATLVASAAALLATALGAAAIPAAKAARIDPAAALRSE
jgi:predicted permease